MPLVNANSVDPDQAPRSAASDLGLHYLPMSHLWDARHKCIKIICPHSKCHPTIEQPRKFHSKIVWEFFDYHQKLLKK